MDVARAGKRRREASGVSHRSLDDRARRNNHDPGNNALEIADYLGLAKENAVAIRVRCDP